MMGPEPKDVIVLGAIRRGEKKFDKIQRITQVDPEELNSILEKLEERGFIQVEEKKGLFGKKIELTVTEKGSTELDERIHEIQERWGNMSQIYKMGDKQKLQECMEENKSFLPMMMFFGVMDMMMFSMMFSMMGMAMTDYVPTDSIPEDSGMDDVDSGMNGEGFDFDIGF
jgi:DNA-binding HxlR family transcriptional regulator